MAPYGALLFLKSTCKDMDNWKHRFVINPDFSHLPVEDGILTGVWYVIVTSQCSDNYHRSYCSMESKLWCFHVPYKPHAFNSNHQRLLKDAIDRALYCKNEIYKPLSEPYDQEAVNEYDYWEEHFLKQNYNKHNMSEVKSIHAAVAEGIKSSGPKVQEIIIAQLVEVEVRKRVAAVDAGLSKLKALNADLKKADKPDIKSHMKVDGKDGLQVVEGYSDELNKRLIKLREDIGKLEGIINKALESNDGESYSKLYDAPK